MATAPQFVGTARTAHVKLVNATGTTAQTLLTMGSNGGLIEGLFITSNDTTSHNLTLLLGDGTTDVLIDTVVLPAATSTTPVQQVNLLDANRLTWLDPNNLKWVLAASRVLKVRMEMAVSSGSFEVAAICNYGEF
ncbi:MAG: hypothetical protein WCG26_13275 [Chloroflexales bacterium]